MGIECVSFRRYRVGSQIQRTVWKVGTLPNFSTLTQQEEKIDIIRPLFLLSRPLHLLEGSKKLTSHLTSKALRNDDYERGLLRTNVPS